MTSGPALLAHGIGGRQDLPMPLSYAVVGGAIALVVSFLALAVLWRTARLGSADAGRPLPTGIQRAVDAPAMRLALRTLGVVAAGYVVLAAVFGPADARNPTAGTVYVLFWVGVPILSLLFGPWWGRVNPLRALHRGLAALIGADPDEGIVRLSPRVGYWPAAIGLLAFVWLELVPANRASLPALRTWFGLYVLANVLCATLFGRRWFARGDAFEAWFGLVGRLAPWGRRADGRLVARSPLDGIAAVESRPGLVALVCVMLGSTAFDAFSSVPGWLRVPQESPLGADVTNSLVLLGFIGAVAALFVGAVRMAGARPAAFAFSLVPIAVGYVVAHYYSLLVVQGQQTVIDLSDPLGTGANWLGTGGDREISGALITPTAIALLQVIAVVVGHVVGVVLAHDRAMQELPRAAAVRGQLPLLLLMVAYTVGGLLLLFAG